MLGLTPRALFPSRMDSFLCFDDPGKRRVKIAHCALVPISRVLGSNTQGTQAFLIPKVKSTVVSGNQSIINEQEILA